MDNQAKRLIDRLQRGDISADEFNDERQRKRITDFSNATFYGIKGHIDLSGCDLSRAAFHECQNIRNFEGSDLTRATFTECSIPDAIFSRATCYKMTVSNCRLASAQFIQANLDSANFAHTDLRRARFERATLKDAALVRVTVDSRTDFTLSDSVVGCYSDRYALACLGSNRGHLTEGNLMDMDIHDDVALLRSQFGGVWAWTHLAAVVAFVTPYLWFLVNMAIVATFADDLRRSLPLWSVLLRYIVSGGETWQSWCLKWPFVTFIVFFIYNVARVVLLWKTKHLETEQHVKGLPVKFILEENTFWKTVYYISWWGFFLAIGVAILHSFHFLMMRVPIE